MLRIGLFGLGTVGGGLLKLLRDPRYGAQITAIVDRSWRGKSDLIGSIPASDDPDLILKNKDIDMVVELVGGIDLPLYIVREALDARKTVVTANKALLAEHGYSLLNKATEMRTELRFEAAVAGAIPIVHNLKHTFIHDRVEVLEGILNGTCNYILTRMRRENLDYKTALAAAQKLGFAEADPTLDVSGADAVHKLVILASLIRGEWFDYHQVHTSGIDSITAAEIRWAEKMKYRIRLIGKYQNREGRDFLSMEPVMISDSHFLWDVEYENNAILVKAENSGRHLMVGKGAGALPTAFSVLSDINSRPETDFRTWTYGRQEPIGSLQTPFYMRLQAENKPGVLAKIARVLGDASISIASVQQESHPEKAELVIVTARTSRDAMEKALATIRSLPEVGSGGVLLAIDESGNDTADGQ